MRSGVRINNGGVYKGVEAGPGDRIVYVAKYGRGAGCLFLLKLAFVVALIGGIIANMPQIVALF